MMIVQRSVVNPRTPDDIDMKSSGDEKYWRGKHLEKKDLQGKKKSRARKSPA
jgi:hypothetical protein